MRRLLVPAAALCLSVTACGNSEEPPPSWYGQRSELPSCGSDVPFSDDYPNLAARSCFRDAFAADRPAELTAEYYGDEGESIRAHFRVLGDGRYEIVGERSPSPVAEYAGGQGWVRYECDRFVFVDDPGAELEGAPWIDAEGECRVVDEVSG
jgi:hypothetical protein